VDIIINTELEKVSGSKDAYEKHIFLEDKVLVVGYAKQEEFYGERTGEETVRSYYWYWELRDSESWDLLKENHDKDFTFCESDLGNWNDDDRVEDLVGDISESGICTWSDQYLIEDIAENIAEEVLDWLNRT